MGGEALSTLPGPLCEVEPGLVGTPRGEGREGQVCVSVMRATGGGNLGALSWLWERRAV